MTEIQRSIFASLEAGLTIVADSGSGGLVNFRSAADEPVQRWFMYREGYSEKLVTQFIKEFGTKGLVYDPFCGSGTTLLAARRCGLPATGIDINPFSALISRVKNEPYGNEMPALITKAADSMDGLVPSARVYHTPFPLADKVFNGEILQALLQIKEYADGLQPPPLKQLVLAAWLSIIEQVSNAKKEGNGIKYRFRRRTGDGYVVQEREEWERKNFPADRFSFVRDALKDKLVQIAADIADRYGRCSPAPVVECGSCLDEDKMPDREIELTFFSPPYCNCFDYFEIHKMELWMGGFVSSSADFRRLKGNGFRSNTSAVKDREVAYQHEAVKKLVGLLGDKLWNIRIPDIIRGYFDDMHTLLARLCEHTVRGGRIGIVVGNSAYGGVVIPTDLLTASIAREAGLTVESIRITRHLTTSSQQIRRLEPLRGYLRESIVLLRK